MQKTLQDFLNGGIQTGSIDVWDNEKKAWRSAGQWKQVREPHGSTPTGMPLVTFDFNYHAGYDGPAISPDLLPPKGHSSVTMIKNGAPGKSGEKKDRAFDAEVPAILRQLTHGGNMRTAQEAKLMGHWGVAADGLPVISGAERLVMNGGVTLTGLRMTVDDGPMNYLPIIGKQAITREADDLVDVVQKGDIASKINFYADQTRNLFAHTALGGATPKFLGYADGNVMVVKPVSKELHVASTVEHLMQQAQREAGINAARTKIIQTSKGNTAMLSGHYGYDQPINPDNSTLPAFGVRRTACSMAALSRSVSNDNPALKSDGYAPMVAAIHQFSAQPKQDREELAKRAIFHLLVNNTDNHFGQFELMRNERNQWVLSPSYDVAPTPNGRTCEFSTTFGGWKCQSEIGSLGKDNLWARLSRDFADEKGVPMPVAQLQAMAVDVSKAVLNLPERMKSAGLPDASIKDYVEKAFWDRADLQSFVKAHEGKTRQQDHSYSLGNR